MYGANRDLQKKEVKMVGVRGKVQPVVITSQTLKIASALDPKEPKKTESFLATCVQRYWHDMKSMVGDILLLEFAAFLKKIGTAWKRIAEETTLEPLRNTFVVAEGSLRKYLIRAGAVLGPVILEDLEEAEPMSKKAIDAVNKAAK